MELRNLLAKTCPQLVSDANWNWYLQCLQSSCNYQVFNDLVEDYSKERIRVGIEKHKETSFTILTDLPLKGITLQLKGSRVLSAVILPHVKLNGVEPLGAYMDITISSGSNNKFFAWSGDAEPVPSETPEEAIWDGGSSNVEWESGSQGYNTTNDYRQLSQYSYGINAFIIEPGIEKNFSDSMQTYYKSKYIAYFNTYVPTPEGEDPSTVDIETSCNQFINWIEFWESKGKSDNKDYILVIVSRGVIYITDALRDKLNSIGGRLIQSEHINTVDTGYHFATVLSKGWSEMRAYESDSLVTRAIPIQDGSIVRNPVRPTISRVNFKYGQLQGSSIPDSVNSVAPFLPSSKVLEQDNLYYQFSAGEASRIGYPFRLCKDSESITGLDNYNVSASNKPYYAVGTSTEFPFEYFTDLSVAVLAAAARYKVLWKIEKIKTNSSGWVYRCHIMNKFILDKHYLITEGQYHIEEDYNEDALLIRSGTTPVFYTVYYDVILSKLDWHPNGFNGKFIDLFGSDMQDIFSLESLASVTRMCGCLLSSLRVTKVSPDSDPSNPQMVAFHLRKIYLLDSFIVSDSLLPGDSVAFTVDSDSKLVTITGVQGNQCSFNWESGIEVTPISPVIITDAVVTRKFGNATVTVGVPLNVSSTDENVQNVIERSLLV